MRLKRDTPNQLYEANKRVRREYPWRNEYIRDFAVRPVQRDELTQAVVLIECSFCVAFGREERPVLNATPTTVDGPIKSRARTRNVAHWKYPFRTDNIRSHHQQQHSTKWKEYVELMEMVKQEQLSIGTHGENVPTPYRDRLDSFFGTTAAAVESIPQRQTDRHVVADILSTTAAIHASSTLSRHPPLLIPFSGSDSKHMSVEISNTTMVEHIVQLLYDPHRRLSRLTYLNRVVNGSKRLKVPSPSPLTLEIPHPLQFQLVLQLASKGIPCLHIASIAPLFSLPESLSMDQVVSNGEAIVIWSLDQISTRMQAAWTYALSFHVVMMEEERVLLQIGICISSNDPGKRETVEDYHLLAIVLPSHDPEDRVKAFLQVVLTAMDRQWMLKLLGVMVHGDVQCLVGTDHEDLVYQLVKDHLHGQTPFYWTSTSLELVETALQSAWTRTYKELMLNEETRAFLSDLEAVVTSLRHGTTLEWRRAHGECPVLVRYNVWTVYHALQWIIGHKDVVQSTTMYGCPILSTTWWLVAHILMDILAVCEGHHTTTTSSSSEKEVMADLIEALRTKCGIRQQSTSLMDVSFDAGTSTWQWKTLTWTQEDMIACIRSFNLSTRRLYQEITGTVDEDVPSPRAKTKKATLKSPTATTRVETLTAHVVLVMTEALQDQYSTIRDRENQLENVLYVPPPSTPLAFVQLGLHEPTKASAAVDFVEFHSKRLELSFPTGFLDTITREIQELSALVTQDPALETQLMEMSPSWAPVPQFTALRTLAAGLATVQPTLERQVVKELQPSLLAASTLITKEGLDVRSTFGDLGLEMTLHAGQFERLMQQHKEEEVIGI